MKQTLLLQSIRVDFTVTRTTHVLCLNVAKMAQHVMGSPVACSQLSKIIRKTLHVKESCTAEECCNPNPVCTGFSSCSAGTQLINNPENVQCASATCAESDCCVETYCDPGQEGEYCSACPSGKYQPNIAKASAEPNVWIVRQIMHLLMGSHAVHVLLGLESMQRTFAMRVTIPM